MWKWIREKLGWLFEYQEIDTNGETWEWRGQGCLPAPSLRNADNMPKPRKVRVEIKIRIFNEGRSDYLIYAQRVAVFHNKPTRFSSRKSCLRAARRVANELWPGCEIEVVK
jgi:hypothetical protein